MSALRHFRTSAVDEVELKPPHMVEVGSSMKAIASDRIVFELYRHRGPAALTSWMAMGLCTPLQEQLWEFHKQALCHGMPTDRQQSWLRRDFRDVWLEVATLHKTPIDTPFTPETLVTLGSKISPATVAAAWQQPLSRLAYQRAAIYHMLLEREHLNTPHLYDLSELTLAQRLMLHLSRRVEMDMTLLPEKVLASLLEADLGI